MSVEKDFSALADQYARFRPTYPKELIAYLATLAPSNRAAWDAGTGNGQAARALAANFERVYASDASFKQLAAAPRSENLLYLAGRAESLPVCDAALDLVTVAQAVHWFDLPAFFAEVQRALKRGGVLAVWTYPLPHIAPAIDAIDSRYYYEILGPYWTPGVHWVEAEYRTLPFPFAEIHPPAFEMQADWGLDALLGFLASWSATPGYMQAHGHHPLLEIQDELQRAWGDPAEVKPVSWPVHLRVGRA